MRSPARRQMPLLRPALGKAGGAGGSQLGPRLRPALGRAGREEGRLLARQGLAVMRAAGALEFLSAGISHHACPMPPESQKHGDLGRKRASRCEQQPDQKPCFLPMGVPWGRTAPPSPPRPRQEDVTAREEERK